MPKRVLFRGGHVLSMDPAIGDLYGGDVLVEDDTHRGRRAVDRGRRRRGRRRDRVHRHPRVHRLAPAHVGDGDPRDRAGRQPRRLLRPRARPARAGLPARGRVRRQLPRLARGDRRRRDDAARLVAHQQHARALGRGDPRASRTPGCEPSTATATRTPRLRTGGTRARSSRPRTSAASATSTSRATTG